mmetsp:Transcript_29945/g.70547  ORF Transcript_29945/g.70547 Transcript_29945/m.70547 type:complete len:163 (-) Transcript_29945:429-917(-)
MGRQQAPSFAPRMRTQGGSRLKRLYLVELGNHHPALADLVMASAGPRFAALSNMRSPCKPEAAGFTSQEHGIHSVHNEPTRLASRHSFLSTTCPDEESLAAGISFPPNRLLHNQHVLHMDQLLEDISHAPHRLNTEVAYRRRDAFDQDRRTDAIKTFMKKLW